MNPFGEIYTIILMSGIVLTIPWLAQALVPAAQPETPDEHPLPRDARGRYTIFDTLRGIAIFAVVIIHVCYFFTPNTAEISEAFLNAVNASMRFAIPVFLIASGALLTPPQRTAKALRTFYVDKVVRIGVPYLLMCIVLALLTRLEVSEFLEGFITGTLSVPFYFVIVLFQLYLVYPFLEPLAHKRWFIYATLGVTILNQLIPLYWTIAGVPTFFQYFFFFAWGIYMRTQLIQQARSAYNLRPWFVFIALFAIFYTLYPGLYYNIRPYYGPAVFMLLYIAFSHARMSEKVTTFLASIGRHSLWIFLIHFPLMGILLPVVKMQTAMTGIPFFFLALSVSLVTSTALAYLIAHMYTISAGYIRKISGGTA